MTATPESGMGGRADRGEPANRGEPAGSASQGAGGDGDGGGDDLSAWMSRQGSRVERALEAVLPASAGARGAMTADGLVEAMRYAVLGGGKRVRPLLVYAAGEVSAAAPEVLDATACAVELIHAYSLVHDDMPCMDNDELRRGRPTVHKKYGEALAMLVGDALQALAFEALVSPLSRDGDPGRAQVPVAEMVRVLAAAAGSAGMAGGQALDLAAVGARLDRAQLEQMHRMKTGAMLAASVHLGLLGGGGLTARMAEAAAGYGDAVGLAFQVVDDILDVTADSGTLGKTAGKDQAQDKPTYVSVLGLAQSRSFARHLGQRARQSLEPLGASASRLAGLTDFIVNRVS